ncbi:MAG TPA: dTMP kinase [Patescibacteria group bacterium]|nr:dTMP kinase [Patescibacteria group bacterium]
MYKLLGHRLPGKYFVFEGIGGCGKSIQAKLLHEFLKERYPDREIVYTHEPGGTEKSEQVRDVIISHSRSGEGLVPYSEAFLLAASRCQAIAVVLRPALERGAIVVSERSFFSSLAYQGFARGLGWKDIWRINQIAVAGVCPDVVFYLDVAPEVGRERKSKRKKRDCVHDYQDLEYFHRVRKGYLFISKMIGRGFEKIDGSLPLEKIAKIIEKKAIASIEKPVSNQKW